MEQALQNASTGRHSQPQRVRRDGLYPPNTPRPTQTAMWLSARKSRHSAREAERDSLQALRLWRWRSVGQQLWTETWTEANFCKVHMRGTAASPALVVGTVSANLDLRSPERITDRAKGTVDHVTFRAIHPHPDSACLHGATYPGLDPRRATARKSFRCTTHPRRDSERVEGAGADLRRRLTRFSAFPVLLSNSQLLWFSFPVPVR